MGVAREMKDKYDNDLELKILTTDSKEAKPYNFRSATNVLLNDELVPLDVATDLDKMDTYLSENM